MRNSPASALRVAAAVTLGILATGMLGCSPQPEPSPTPTAAFASEEEAFAAAEEVYRAYIDASNRVDLSDPSSFDALDEYTADPYQADEHQELSELHANEVTQNGDIKTIWFHATESDLESIAKATACNDVSATDLVDREGKSLVDPDRPPRYALALTFSIVGTELRLTGSEAIEDPECV